VEKIVIIKLKWTHGVCSSGQKSRFVLDRVSLLTALMVFVVRPGYRIVSRTIKRGSRVSNLVILFEESSNLCILGIIFLGSYLAFLYGRFYIFW
jgi:hypothetical protein